MDNKIKMRMIVSTILCLVPILFGVMVYSKLPDRVAIHFDSYGDPNGYLNRPAAVFLLPVFMAVINVISQVSIETDPKKKNQLPLMKAFFVWLVPIISIGVQSFILIYALGHEFNGSNIVGIITGIVIVIVGNYLPKCRQNNTIGIKLPWTLNDSDNWNKTHRLAGILWVIGGLFIISTSFIELPEISFIITVLAIVIIPSIYSFILSTKSKA